MYLGLVLAAVCWLPACLAQVEAARAPFRFDKLEVFNVGPCAINCLPDLCKHMCGQAQHNYISHLDHLK